MSFENDFDLMGHYNNWKTVDTPQSKRQSWRKDITHSETVPTGLHIHRRDAALILFQGRFPTMPTARKSGQSTFERMRQYDNGAMAMGGASAQRSGTVNLP